MTEDTQTPLTDEDISTVLPGRAVLDQSDDTDGTDGGDTDGTDGGDTDGTDA